MHRFITNKHVCFEHIFLNIHVLQNLKHICIHLHFCELITDVEKKRSNQKEKRDKRMKHHFIN